MLTSFGAGTEKEHNKNALELETWRRHNSRPYKAARVTVLRGWEAQRYQG